MKQDTRWWGRFFVDSYYKGGLKLVQVYRLKFEANDERKRDEKVLPVTITWDSPTRKAD